MESIYSNEQLCALIQQGKSELVATLWAQNEPFIRSVATAYILNFPIEKRDLLDDCIQESYLDMPKIVKNFKPDFGSFLAYLKQSLRTTFRSVMFETGRGRRAENDLLNQCTSLDAMLKTDNGDELPIDAPDILAQEEFDKIEDEDYRQKQNAFIRECIQLSCNDTGKAILTEMLNSNCSYRDAINNLYGPELDEETIDKLRKDKNLSVRQIRRNEKTEMIRKKYDLESYSERNGLKGYTLSAFRKNGFTSEVERIVLKTIE